MIRTSVRSSVGAYAGTARQLPSGHRPGRRQARHARIQWNPFIGTTVGTDESGPIRWVVLLMGWSKMAPSVDGKTLGKFRSKLYIHDSVKG